MFFTLKLRKGENAYQYYNYLLPIGLIIVER